MTELKEARRALREEKEKFQMLLEFAPFGVMLVDGDGTFRYLNPTFTEMFGYQAAEIRSGREWFMLAFPDRTYREESHCGLEENKKEDQETGRKTSNVHGEVQRWNRQGGALPSGSVGQRRTYGDMRGHHGAEASRNSAS